MEVIADIARVVRHRLGVLSRRVRFLGCRVRPLQGVPHVVLELGLQGVHLAHDSVHPLTHIGGGFRGRPLQVGERYEVLPHPVLVTPLYVIGGDLQDDLFPVNAPQQGYGHTHEIVGRAGLPEHRQGRYTLQAIGLLVLPRVFRSGQQEVVDRRRYLLDVLGGHLGAR